MYSLQEAEIKHTHVKFVVTISKLIKKKLSTTTPLTNIDQSIKHK